jgi:hypothetical protein
MTDKLDTRAAGLLCTVDSTGFTAKESCRSREVETDLCGPSNMLKNKNIGARCGGAKTHV